MIDIVARRKEIENELQGLVTNDERMKVIVSRFEELKTKLKIDSDEDFAKYRKDSKDAAETEAVDLNNIDNNDNQQENLDLDSDFEDDEQLGHEHRQEQRGAA